MIETTFARQDIDEPEIDPIHRDGARQRLQVAQAAQLAEAAGGLPLLHQHLERQPAGRAPMTPPLLWNPIEMQRLVLQPDPAAPQKLLQILEGDGGVHVPAALRQTHARVDHSGARAVQMPQIARLRRHRRRDRRQVGDELRVLGLDGLHDDRTGAADHRAPALVRQHARVLARDQLVPQHPPVHGPEARDVARVDELFGGGGIKVGGRLDGEDQRRAAALGELQGPFQVATSDDGVVRARREAEPTPRTRLVDDRDPLLLHRHRVGGAHPYAREARHATL